MGRSLISGPGTEPDILMGGDLIFYFLFFVLKLRIFSWMNCVLLSVLTRLYLDDMALEANILLLLLSE